MSHAKVVTLSAVSCSSFIRVDRASLVFQRRCTIVRPSRFHRSRRLKRDRRREDEEEGVSGEEEGGSGEEKEEDG